MPIKSKYFEIVESTAPANVAPVDGEVARGKDWYITFLKDIYELHYISGEQGGKSRRLRIKENEYREITEQEVPVDYIINRYIG